MKTLIQCIAHNCNWEKTVNEAYRDICESRIEKLEKELPSGSGVDCGSKIDIKNSNDKKIVITFDFHHMNEDGCYNGWTSHKLTVIPTLEGNIEMKISGRDRNQIKDYLYDLYHAALTETIIDESVFYES